MLSSADIGAPPIGPSAAAPHACTLDISTVGPPHDATHTRSDKIASALVALREVDAVTDLQLDYLYGPEPEVSGE